MNKGLDKANGGTERSFTAAVTRSHAEAGVGDLTESERGGEGTPLWLPSCRRIELPKGADMPVLWRGGDSVSSASEAYKSLRTRMMRAQASRNFNSVVVTSAAPGDGKTLTAFNLGFCYAQMEDTPVLLVDGDLRIATLGTRFVSCYHSYVDIREQLCRSRPAAC